jgi:hypothetical protein
MVAPAACGIEAMVTLIKNIRRLDSPTTLQIGASLCPAGMLLTAALRLGAESEKA